MQAIGIIGLDLDGTLLDADKKITERTYLALEAAAAQGVHLVPVTGRPRLGIPENVSGLPFVRYLISCNGAAIWDQETAGPVREVTIPCALAVQVAQLVEQYGMSCEALCRGVGYAESWVYECMIAQSPPNSFLRRYVQQTRKTVESLPQFLQSQAQGAEEFFVMCGKQAPETMAQELKKLGALSIVSPTPQTLELTADGVDKGEALLHLAAQLGVPSGGVMAIGDSGNDLAMLKAADFPVAMGNATDQVKRIAAFTTAGNNEDGVALAIERFVLAKSGSAAGTC